MMSCQALLTFLSCRLVMPCVLANWSCGQHVMYDVHNGNGRLHGVVDNHSIGHVIITLQLCD